MTIAQIERMISRLPKAKQADLVRRLGSKSRRARIAAVVRMLRRQADHGVAGRQPQGLLGSARLFAGWKGFDAVMGDVVRRRDLPRRRSPGAVLK